MKYRCYAFDNLKCFLIYCVVFGHMLILVPEDNIKLSLIKDVTYYIIYSFHMPAFIFISGFFSKFSLKKILKLIGYYVLFQVIYYLFEVHILGNSLKFQLHSPYYVFWYLLTLSCYIGSSVLLKRLPNNLRVLILLILLLFSLQAGNFSNIGYTLSLSRTLVFFPVYALGVFAGCESDRFWKLISRVRKYALALPFITLLITYHSYRSGYFTTNMLWGVLPYSYGYGPLQRAELILMSLLWTFSLLSVFLNYLNYDIPVVSQIGSNTLSVYLLHGFIVNSMILLTRIDNMLYLALLSSAIVILLGYPRSIIFNCK